MRPFELAEADHPRGHAMSEASERENAAWRGWADDVSRLLHAIDYDLSVSQGGKVYTQHLYARMLASRFRQINESRFHGDACDDT